MATKESIKLEIDKKRLSEFYGALPATQPYPGTEEIREIVCKSLAQKIINEE